MTIPEAQICHFTTGRIRLKIAECREDHGYFQSVRDKFQKAGYGKTVINPLTGSIVIEKENLSADDIGDFAQKRKLFILKKQPMDKKSLVQQVTAPFSMINTDLKKLSGGDIDLPIAIFIFLLTFGLIEIIRGNFKMPPWYTAFWYAFGVFSKSVFDSRAKNNI